MSLLCLWHLPNYSQYELQVIRSSQVLAQHIPTDNPVLLAVSTWEIAPNHQGTIGIMEI